MEKYVHGGYFPARGSILDFSVNLNPLGPPGAVREAAVRSMDAIEYYPDPEHPELMAALAASEGVTEDSLILGNGAAELIDLFIRTLHPKQAVLPVPSFYEYERSLASVGCEIRFVPYDEKNGFLPDERIAEAVTEETDLVIVCHPNNPTGRLFPAPLRKKLIRRCMKTDTWVMADECFLQLVPETGYFETEKGEDAGSFRKYFPAFSRIFLLNAFTKTYAIPGLRLGYGISPDPEMICRMREQIQPWNISVPAEAAGIAALEETGYLPETHEMIRREREKLYSGLTNLGMEVYPGFANFLLFRYPQELEKRKELCQEQAAVTSRTLGSALLEKGILIRDCSNFRSLERGYYRIAVRGPEDNRRLLSAIGDIRADNTTAD